MKSPHTGTEAHGHTSSATPRPEGTRDVLDVLASSIAKLESTVRYLGIEVDDALEISEQTEI